MRFAQIKPKVGRLNTGRPTLILSNPNATPRKRGRAGQAQRLAVLKRDLYTCKACGHISQENQADHIIPLEAGGMDHIGNMQTLCQPCHAAKTAKEASDRSNRR